MKQEKVSDRLDKYLQKQDKISSRLLEIAGRNPMDKIKCKYLLKRS